MLDSTSVASDARRLVLPLMFIALSEQTHRVLVNFIKEVNVDE